MNRPWKTHACGAGRGQRRESPGWTDDHDPAHTSVAIAIAIAIAIATELQSSRRFGQQRATVEVQHPASSIQPAHGILTSGVRPHTSQSGKRCRCRRRISKSLGGAMATYSLHECASTHFANAFTPPLPPTDRQRSSRPGRRSRRVLLYRRQMCCMLPCAAQSYPGPALVVVDQMEVAPG
jgi:hypothetical protein